MDSKGDVKQFFGMRFAWHGLESCCCSGVSEPASKGLAPMVSELRPQLGCRTKGDVKQFFGMRFAWHGLESCCCSGVSEPASKGLAPMVSELRPQLGCRTKALVFMRSKGIFLDAIFLRFRWGSAVLTRVFFPWPWPCQQREIALLGLRFFLFL